MKILYISQYFPPEMGAPAARACELSRYWVAAGHEVTVLTGFPNHPTGVVPLEYRTRLRHLVCREEEHGIDVRRTWLWPLPNRRSWERMLNYSSFACSAALRGLFLDRPDVIIATSPQLLVGLSGLWLSKIRGIPLIFEVRDLWPESLEAVGVSSGRSILHRTLGLIATTLYRRSDHIVVVTPAFREYLAERFGVPVTKMSVVVNGVEADVFTPAGEKQSVIDEFGLADKFVVSFIGTMGNAHGLSTVIRAAQKLETAMPDTLFLLVGEGAEKERLGQLVTGSGLSNIRIVGQQPRKRVPALIRASHACMVLLKRSSVFQTVIPSKMLEFMACERPVILGVEGQAQHIIERAAAGICIPPEDADALAAAVRQLRLAREWSAQLGRNGRRYVLKYMSREQTAKDYLAILQMVSGKQAAAAPARELAVSSQ